MKQRVPNVFQNKAKSYLCFPAFRPKEAIAWTSVLVENIQVRDYFISKIEPIILTPELPRKKLPFSKHAHSSNYQESHWDKKAMISFLKRCFKLMFSWVYLENGRLKCSLTLFFLSSKLLKQVRALWPIFWEAHERNFQHVERTLIRQGKWD